LDKVYLSNFSLKNLNKFDVEIVYGFKIEVIGIIFKKILLNL